MDACNLRQTRNPERQTLSPKPETLLRQTPNAEPETYADMLQGSTELLGLVALQTRFQEYIAFLEEHEAVEDTMLFPMVLGLGIGLEG
jgi:hypothetical protein